MRNRWITIAAVETLAPFARNHARWRAVARGAQNASFRNTVSDSEERIHPWPVQRFKAPGIGWGRSFRSIIPESR